MKRILITLLVAVGLIAPAAPALAGDRPAAQWVGTNPYNWGMGDSLYEQCRENMGLDWRSLGLVAWPGATTTMMRERFSSTAEGWPWTTESSHAEELTWFRDAGSWAIGLGTNDVKSLTVDEWRANIDWFMTQSRGRPVAWYTIVNPPFQAQVDAFNAELFAATDRWPNLKVIRWDQWVAAHPGAMSSDRVHVETYEYGCQQGRHRLLQHAVADEPGKIAPRGFWYGDPATEGPIHINGWAAGNEESRQDVVEVNVRTNYVHFGRFTVNQWTADLWAQTASGRGFGIAIPAEYRGQTVCVDLVDAGDRFTSLGCRAS